MPRHVRDRAQRGLVPVGLAMFGGLTGYDLPDALPSGTGSQVVNGTVLSIPVVGTYVSFLLFGGEFPLNRPRNRPVRTALGVAVPVTSDRRSVSQIRRTPGQKG